MDTSPPPGIYPNVPFEDYAAWPYISNSKLHAACKSMMHYHEQNYVEENKAMQFGSLCHAGKLDPLSIALRYVVMPAYEKQVRKADGSEYDKPKATAEYKRLAKEFAEQNPTKIIVSAVDYTNMVAVVRSLCSHARSRDYLDGPGPCEVSIVWDDTETGLRLKGRLDKLSLESTRITDLKTTRDPLRFEKEIGNRGYHRQGAMYRDGIHALKGVTCEVCLVAVENAAPWGVRAAPVDENSLDAGQKEYRTLLSKIKECQRANDWPGYENPEMWILPPWLQPEEEMFT